MRTVETTLTGVINLETGYEASLRVNQTNVLDVIGELIDSLKPETDWNSAFAGRIKIELSVYDGSEK